MRWDLTTMSEATPELPYFSVGQDDALHLTVEPTDLTVCSQCPNLHIRIFGNATPDNLRRFAAGILHLADHIEHRVIP
jgi:hypothetical protein